LDFGKEAITSERFHLETTNFAGHRNRQSKQAELIKIDKNQIQDGHRSPSLILVIAITCGRFELDSFNLEPHWISPCLGKQTSISGMLKFSNKK